VRWTLATLQGDSGNPPRVTLFFSFSAAVSNQRKRGRRVDKIQDENDDRDDHDDKKEKEKKQNR
jgi:hypothetical protein